MSALLQAGVEVLYDDRDLGPGEKFADAELLGCPLRLTVGRRSLESGEAEVQIRRGREDAPGYRWTATASACGEPWTSCGRAFRRGLRARGRGRPAAEGSTSEPAPAGRGR